MLLLWLVSDYVYEATQTMISPYQSDKQHVFFVWVSHMSCACPKMCMCGMILLSIVLNAT